MKLMTRALATAALPLLFLACSAKVSGGSGDAPPMIDPPKPAAEGDKVQGPALDGDWISGCFVKSVVQDGKFVDMNAVIKMSIKAKTVSRVTSLYADSGCRTLSKTNMQNGTYRFIEKQASDVYIVEYRFDLGHGAAELPEEQIRLAGDALYVSDFGLALDKKLTRVGATSPSSPSTNGATCEQRAADMKDLGARGQGQLEKAMHNAFQGIPAQPATGLRNEAQAFGQKYANLRCDGQTTQNFVDQINREADEIDQLQ